MASPKLGSKGYKGPVHEAVRNSPLGFLFGKQGSSTRAASPTTTTRTPMPPTSSYSGIQQVFMKLPAQKQSNAYKLMSRGVSFRGAVQAQSERSNRGSSMFSIPTASTAKAMLSKATTTSKTRSSATTSKAKPKMRKPGTKRRVTRRRT